MPAKPGEHPLHRIVRRQAPGQEIALAAATRADHPREVNAGHFSATVQVPPGSHVLLIDDTWARGGHAQSGALALRKAGAALVSVLVVARWVNADFADNTKFLRELSRRDYDPQICPWTGGDCPDVRQRG